MGTLVLKDVDDRLIAQLRALAERHGRSVEAQHLEILQKTIVDAEMVDSERADTLRRMDALRAATVGRRHTPSEILQREGREERWG